MIAPEPQFVADHSTVAGHRASPQRLHVRASNLVRTMLRRIIVPDRDLQELEPPELVTALLR